jgi:hypothetical protein
MRIPIALIVTLTATGFAQMSSNVSLSNGVQLTISCNSNPSALNIDLEPASGNSFYRIFRDENNLAIFVYELQVERTPDGDHFRVTAKPAGDDFATRFPNADGGKPTPTLPEPRQSPLLASGDKFTIDIAVIPGIGNLSDTVQVRLNARGASSEQASQSAPLRFAGLKVQINGQVVSASGPGATVAGRYVMFYVPGHGAYFLSTETVESPAFAKIGVVDHTHLHFTLDNETYDCDSEAPILGTSDRGEIWVYHDPNYKPSGNWTSSDPSTQRDEFFAAASDSLKWWLP